MQEDSFQLEMVKESKVDLVSKETQLAVTHKLKLSPVERERLGERAKCRRIDMSMSRQYLASKAGTHSSNLVMWERSLPTFRRAVEENWEAALQVPSGWLRDLSIATPAIIGIFHIDFPAEATVAAEIRRIANWTSRKHIYQRSFEYADLAPNERRQADIFAQRYGVDGEDSSIMNVIGDRFEVTSERIRQIAATMTERVAGTEFVTPKFDILISTIKTLVPRRLDELDVILRPLLGDQLSIEGADRFARDILGKAVAVVTDRPAGMAYAWDKVVIAEDSHDAESLRCVRDAARAMIRSVGAAQVYFVAGAASQILGQAISHEKVLQCCKLISGFEWLIEIDGWFWFGTENGDNRFIPLAHKVLAVANRSVDVEEIHAALVRSRRDRYDPDQPRPYLIEATIDVVTEILRRLPGVITIQSNNFKLRDRLPLNDVLSETEMEIFECLSSHGGVAAAATLTRDLIETGRVKYMALQVCLNSTPILLQIDVGLYVLRGYSLSPESLAEEAAAVGGNRYSTSQKLMQLGDGIYAVEFELTKYMLQTRFFSVSAAVANILIEGDYQIEGTDSTAHYIILDGGARRLRQLINKIVDAGVSEGGSVRLIIHSKKRLIQIQKLESV